MPTDVEICRHPANRRNQRYHGTGGDGEKRQRTNIDRTLAPPILLTKTAARRGFFVPSFSMPSIPTSLDGRSGRTIVDGCRLVRRPVARATKRPAIFAAHGRVQGDRRRGRRSGGEIDPSTLGTPFERGLDPD